MSRGSLVCITLAGSARFTATRFWLKKNRTFLRARKAIQQNMIALEMSLIGLLLNFGLKVGMISRDRFEAHTQELADGNPMLETSTAPMLRARASLLQELVGLKMRVR